MGMLVTDVTALVASLAKVCQARLRGGRGPGRLGGSGPATGHSCEARPSAAGPLGRPFLLPGGAVASVVRLFIRQALVVSGGVRHHARCGERRHRARPWLRPRLCSWLLVGAMGLSFLACKIGPVASAAPGYEDWMG